MLTKKNIGILYCIKKLFIDKYVLKLILKLHTYNDEIRLMIFISIP